MYCHDCRDFVYDPTFEEIRTGHNSRKRKHSALQPEDRRLIATNTGTTPCAATGLRGMYNMGQTCFMSVILQSLVHNPLIRSYYLSEGHKSADCEREACTSCALDDTLIRKVSDALRADHPLAANPARAAARDRAIAHLRSVRTVVT